MRRLPPRGATERDRDFAISQLIEGRNNANGTVTLTAGSTTTTIASPTINENSGIWLFPKTANAAAALATTYASVVAGQATITHANTGTTDRTFYYIILGG